MKTFDRVYVAKIKLYKTYEDGKYRHDDYNIICYTLEDALKTIFNSIRGDMMYSQNHSPTRKGMLLYLNNNTDKFSFCVEEYSTSRQRFYSQEELAARFKELTEHPKEGIYDDLLALVDHNKLYYNSFCEQTRVCTVPQKIDGKVFAEGNFMEEDCAEGRYGGDFRYLPKSNHVENQEPYDGKLYFAYVHMVRRNIDANDSTFCELYLECFYSLEEALEAGIEFYYSKIIEYVPDCRSPNKAILDEIAKEKLYNAYISVRIVSNERIRFEGEDELMEYYIDHVLDVKPADMYDFLLKFMDYDERFYDSHGEYLFSASCLQGDEYWSRMLPDFSMETAKDLCFSVEDKRA